MSIGGSFIQLQPSSCLPPPLPPHPLPALQRPLENPQRYRRRSTNASSVTGHSVGVNIAADTRGRVSSPYISSVHSGVDDHGGVVILPPPHLSSIHPPSPIPTASTSNVSHLTYANDGSCADTKERPFKCLKCRSTFVRRDLLLRHDRTVHAKDGGIPLHSEVKRRPGVPKTSPKAGPSKRSLELDTATLEQIEASSDGMVDLETAAMLMTDLHHKATAAMTNQDDVVDEASTPYSPDHTTMFDSSVPYLSSALPLPQMPWDTFMSQSVIEPKAHSISSSLSGSQDSQLSQLSFTSASTVHPHANPLPPMMERYPSAGDSLAPALQSLTGSMPMSGPGTPNGLSPYPFLTGPVSPVDYRRSPGPSQALTSPKAPQIQSDEEYDAMQENMKKCDREGATQVNFHLQTRGDVNACLSAYFNLFHHHLPFLHPESFKLGQVSPPLLLAVLSIGALYTFDQDKAYVMHIGSKVLVNQFLQNKESFSSRKCPLWTMQSTLLNMIFASWSGDPKGLEWACSIKSLLTNVSAAVPMSAVRSNGAIDGRWQSVRVEAPIGRSRRGAAKARRMDRR